MKREFTRICCMQLKLKMKLFSCVRLFATPWTVAYQPAIHGIFQARILEWATISFSRGSSQPRDRTQVSCIADRRFTIWATGKPWSSWSYALQLNTMWTFEKGMKTNNGHWHKILWNLNKICTLVNNTISHVNFLFWLRFI